MGRKKMRIRENVIVAKAPLEFNGVNIFSKGKKTMEEEVENYQVLNLFE